ncbi:uncharacterized protein A4U43_C02F16430 [Asparagus officinalis]|uniref:Uncharacterized protein n=1 Tax=Asparagus officinalis TaxID=4686 RepID=A0A5P1FJK2_ASPOF|nr:uncharacterized protein A4U43_C02F16430 [Asparagus officinalis]
MLKSLKKCQNRKMLSLDKRVTTDKKKVSHRRDMKQWIINTMREKLSAGKIDGKGEEIEGKDKKNIGEKEIKDERSVSRDDEESTRSILQHGEETLAAENRIGSKNMTDRMKSSLFEESERCRTGILALFRFLNMDRMTPNWASDSWVSGHRNQSAKWMVILGCQKSINDPDKEDTMGEKRRPFSEEERQSSEPLLLEKDMKGHRR